MPKLISVEGNRLEGKLRIVFFNKAASDVRLSAQEYVLTFHVDKRQ